MSHNLRLLAHALCNYKRTLVQISWNASAAATSSVHSRQRANRHCYTPDLSVQACKNASLRWRCGNVMRFLTLEVALFFSNGICAGMLQYAFCFVYR